MRGERSTRRWLLGALVAGSIWVPPGEVAAELFLDEAFGVRKTRNLVYRAAAPVGIEPGARDLEMHVWEPLGAAVPAAKPAILFVHGGGFNGGITDWNEDYMEAFASRGWVAFALKFRNANTAPPAPPIPGIDDFVSELEAAIAAFSPGDVWKATAITAQVQDVITCLRFIRDHASDWGVDGTRIALAGSSAGATLVQLVTTVADDVGYGSMPRVGAVQSLWGANPLDLAVYVEPGEPPQILIHGSADAVVPVQSSRDIQVALEAQWIPNALHVIPGVGHGLAAYETFEDPAYAQDGVLLLDHALLFFFEHLDLAHMDEPGPGGRTVPTLPGTGTAALAAGLWLVAHRLLRRDALRPQRPVASAPCSRRPHHGQ